MEPPPDLPQMPPPPPKYSNNKIKDIQNIDDLNVDTFKIQVFKSCFGSFRKILDMGPNNIFLALISAIIDYSIVHETTEIIGKIFYLNQQEVEFEEETLGRINNLLEEFKNLIESPMSFKDKCDQINNLYQYSDDLVLCMRKCAKECVKVMYYNRPYELIRAINEGENKSVPRYLSVIMNETSTLATYDYYMLLDYLDIQLTMLGIDSLVVNNFPGTGKHRLNFLEMSQGYYPLYTLEEAFIQSVSKEESQQLQKFLRKQREEVEEEFKEASTRLSDAEEKNNQAAGVLFGLITSLHPGITIEEAMSEFGGINLEEVLSGYFCTSCKRVVAVARLECGHSFCKDDLRDNNFLLITHCKKCGEYANTDTITRFFTSN